MLVFKHSKLTHACTKQAKAKNRNSAYLEIWKAIVQKNDDDTRVLRACMPMRQCRRGDDKKSFLTKPKYLNLP